MANRKIKKSGWIAIADYGNGDIVVEGDQIEVYTRRPHGWCDDTRWVKVDIDITVKKNARKYQHSSRGPIA